MQLKIDENFAEQVIPANDSVRLVDQIVEEMDLRSLKRAYSDTGRPPATPMRTMLKVVLYSTMEHIYSSRRIRQACQRDINYIWLLDGAPAPSHHEIARFRSKRLSECAEELFYQLVQKLKEYGELTYEHLFVDGTKIEANANKYTFVWKKSTNKYEARLDEKIKTTLAELRIRYSIECDDCSGCPHKKSCTKSKGNRKLQVSKKFIEQRKTSLARITSELGVLLRINRSIQSEGAFGVIKQDYGFRQFLLRGKKKVSTEIFLVAMAFDVNKLHAKIQNNRTGKQLFKKVAV